MSESLEQVIADERAAARSALEERIASLEQDSKRLDFIEYHDYAIWRGTLAPGAKGNEGWTISNSSVTDFAEGDSLRKAIDDAITKTPAFNLDKALSAESPEAVEREK